MKDYAHYAAFRRVWSLTAGEGWQTVAEAHYGLDASTIEAVNAPLDEGTVRSLKLDLLDELDAHRAYLQSLLAQADAMKREVACAMDGAAVAAGSRRLQFGPHESVVQEILMEGEFA